MLQNKGLLLGTPELISFAGRKFKRKISLNGPGKWFNYPLYVKNHLSRLRKVDQLSEKMFVLSNWYKSILLLNGLDESKIVILPPALPASNGQIRRENKNSVSDKIRFVYAGRISYIKGLHILLKAILRLKRTNWELDIYGPIFEKEYYESCVRMTMHNSSVRWKGVINNDGMIKTLTA
jgi:glycosyltransferase involved in cell wall biosynthesis